MMIVEFIVNVVAEVPDDTSIRGLYFGDNFDIITTKPGAEVVDYSTESTKELKAEESNFQP